MNSGCPGMSPCRRGSVTCGKDEDVSSMNWLSHGTLFVTALKLFPSPKPGCLPPENDSCKTHLLPEAKISAYHDAGLSYGECIGARFALLAFPPTCLAVVQLKCCDHRAWFILPQPKSAWWSPENVCYGLLDA